MDQVTYIAINDICSRYNIAQDMFDYLVINELVNVTVNEDVKAIPESDIAELLAICRLHKELGISLDAMDVIINMRKQMIALSKRVSSLEAKLERIENDRNYHLYNVARDQGLIIEITPE